MADTLKKIPGTEIDYRKKAFNIGTGFHLKPASEKTKKAGRTFIILPSRIYFTFIRIYGGWLYVDS